MVANLNSAVKPTSQFKSLILHWPPSLQLVNDQFFEFCQANKELRIERTAQGDCEIMAPTGAETSWRNSKLITLLSVWAEKEGRYSVQSQAEFVSFFDYL